MISVRDLSFSYGDHDVLKDISFDAVPGEMLYILGHNGAGKSTLLRCMLGLLKGYSGSVTVDGTDVSDMDPREKAMHLAYIPQAANPPFSYSVLDMVLMGTTVQISGRLNPGRREREKALETMDRIGISALSGRSFSKISGGEQQLVLIARALAQGAGVLIMDEPTSSLDYGNQMRVQKQLRKLVNDGYTVVQSSHNPEQAYSFADRIICIKDGMMFREGIPEEVLDENLIKGLYNIEVDMITSEDKRARFFALRDDNEK